MIVNKLLKRCFEILNGAFQYGKYRYIFAAVLAFNILLIYNPFITSHSNPFKLSTYRKYQDPWVLSDFNFSIEGSETVVEFHNSTKTTRPNPRPYNPTDISMYPELRPHIGKSMLNIHDYDFNGPYVGWPLGRVCNETKQIPGLVFLCDNNSGGIGNIRNFILTCIRYAIHAGASGLVIPKIQQRSEKDLSNIFTTGFKPFYYFFDEPHFKYAMSSFCPQIVLYNEVTDIPNAERLKTIVDFYPKSLNIDFDGCDERGVNRHLDKFRLKFDQWLEKKNIVISLDEPATVRLKWATFFEWPIYRDGPEFANTFGDLLRIRSDIRQLAAATIKELSISMGLKPNPSVIEANFLGAHLRTESDALPFWPKFDQQSDGYLNEAKTRELNYIYLASGNSTDSQRFANRALEMHNIKVYTKNDLLHGKEELAALRSLSWDQQGLVDFLVLQKSTFFTGCSFSSFAMNVAVKRHSMTEGIYTRQWSNPGDRFSWLVGPFESWYGDWMFMFECLWP
ncbi:putative alternative oxidase [Erysiphe necator]|uniref:Putative alternative oxidase n=1 Tax=Uncinula necator TaxID=52586 RepID=A0A0B1PDV8_UNCNE|nr:putative alternative oxidase [Erysiphe necator]